MHGILNYLDFEIARKKSLDLVNQTRFKEIIPLSEAIGRVLSKDVICRKKIYQLLITLQWMVLL